MADAVLQRFGADVYPGAIVVRSGIVQTNLPLSGNAGERMTVLALGPAVTASSKKPLSRRDERQP